MRSGTIRKSHHSDTIRFVSNHEGEELSATGQNSFELTNLVVRSDSLKRVMKLAEKVARHPAAVLVTGETGTGKEMIARAIHGYSLR
ncbi:MAG: sigma-54 factor interaction domain-containing protein [Acidobacteriia bacterium]|nr:sigma-54 factor interaction domain-containing protein [Terriglobia bacterium]